MSRGARRSARGDRVMKSSGVSEMPGFAEVDGGVIALDRSRESFFGSAHKYVTPRTAISTRTRRASKQILRLLMATGRGTIGGRAHSKGCDDLH
jgi:hypothetical protein